jgi:hypothetical protein
MKLANFTLRQLCPVEAVPVPSNRIWVGFRANGEEKIHTPGDSKIQYIQLSLCLNLVLMRLRLLVRSSEVINAQVKVKSRQIGPSRR